MTNSRASGPRPGDDLTRWALRVPLPSSRQVGSDRVGRVLVALVQYADGQGMAWPSADTLAADVSGLSRRDVRNALEALADAGLIVATEPRGRGRVTPWRIVRPVDNEAGTPATIRDANLAGNVAGNVAGELAGNMAGLPAMKGSEWKNPPTPHAAAPMHRLEPNARAGLERIIRERRPPFSIEELLSCAYALGGTDPYDGFRIIDHATTAAFDDARSPRSVIVSRLRERGLDDARLLARLRGPGQPKRERDAKPSREPASGALNAKAGQIAGVR